jgi:hypothetical protein
MGGYRSGRRGPQRPQVGDGLALDRSFRRLGKAHARLGGGRWPGVHAPCPPRPKRMRRRTYAALAAREREAKARLREDYLEGLTRLLARKGGAPLGRRGRGKPDESDS